MSAPAPEGPAMEEKKGLSKIVSRAKTLMRNGSKRLSISRPGRLGALTAPQDDTSAAKPAEPEQTKAPEQTQTTAVTTTEPQPKRVLRSEIEAERARRLAERFKIQIQPRDWGYEDKEAFRIEKPIRMRIHRSCHKCGTTYGSNKMCMKCEHVRCTKCPRYPTKKEKGKSKERPTGYIEPDYGYMLAMEKPLTKPSRTGGQPLVRKMPMQRVRRTCHLCSVQFLQGNKACPKCSHLRCADCPREPAKKKKYPYGYPGDQPSATSPYFSCHLCTKVYLPIREGNEKPECLRCKHIYCEKCPHATPRKVEPEADKDVMRSVEAKIAAMKLGSSAAAA